MGYVFVPTWCLLLLLKKKKKEVAEQTVAFFLQFHWLWNDCHWEFPEMGHTVQSSFPVTVSKTSQLCHYWSPILLLYFFPPWWWIIVFSSILKLNSLMPGPTAVIDSVPALAQWCSASGENENTGDTIWMHSSFFCLFVFFADLLWLLAKSDCTGLYSNSPLASFQFCHFWCRFEFFFQQLNFLALWQNWTPPELTF